MKTSIITISLLNQVTINYSYSFITIVIINNWVILSSVNEILLET